MILIYNIEQEISDLYQPHMHTVQELEMFSLTKKILDTVYRWHEIATGKRVLVSLAVTIGTALFFLTKLLDFPVPGVVVCLIFTAILWVVNLAIAECKWRENKMDKVFLPFWLTFLPFIPFALIADITKWFGQSIYKVARGVWSRVWGKISMRQMEKDSHKLIRDGHKPEKIEPLTLRGGPQQVITPALVNRGAIEFITDQLGRKEMINGPYGEEGILIPEYRISEDGGRATAMVTYRLIKDSQVHPNVKKDEVYFRYFVLAFTIDRRKGTLETRVLEEGTDSPSAQVLDGAAKSLWGEQIQRELDKFKPFDARLNEFRIEGHIGPAAAPAQQADGV